MAQTSPGETFRVLKGKEEREHGEHRTHRLVLEVWDSLGTYKENRKKLALGFPYLILFIDNTGPGEVVKKCCRNT